MFNVENWTHSCKMNITDDIFQRIKPESGENEYENRSKTDYDENPKICTFPQEWLSLYRDFSSFLIVNFFLKGQSSKNKL